MKTTAKNDGVAHPHDLLVRSILTDEDVAADFFQHYLTPDLTALIDLKSLKCESPVTIDKNLVETLADLRYSTFFKGTKRQLRVFVFLEHQSKQDKFICFRLLEYVCRAYRNHLATADAGKRNRKTFPYPLAVVLHHGKKPWENLLPMRELIDTVPGVDADILRMPVCLVDLAAIPLEQLRGNAVVRALLDCLQSASNGTLPERFEGIASGLAECKGDARLKSWLTILTKYTMTQCTLQNGMQTIRRILTKVYAKKEAEKMALTLADELRLEGEAKGKAKGKAEGKAEGMMQAIITVLTARFGSMPASLEKKIRTVKNAPRLTELLEKATLCQSLHEFKKECR